MKLVLSFIHYQLQLSSGSGQDCSEILQNWVGMGGEKHLAHISTTVYVFTFFSKL